MIKAFRGFRPEHKFVERVLAPPYDVVSREKAKVIAGGNPLSFLHISKAEIDCPESVSENDASVYRQAAVNLQAMCEQKIFVQDKTPSLYLYRMKNDVHSQTGLVALASLEAYRSNRIRRHENTRPTKETNRCELLKTLEAQISPVLLTYRHNKIIDALVDDLSQKTATQSVTAPDGIEHSLWHISDAAVIAFLCDAFANLDALYVADGHHRSAAAARVDGLEGFLAVAFPDNQLQVLAYHRIVKDLNGLSLAEFVSRCEKDFSVSQRDKPVVPTRAGELGVFLQGQWYQFRFNGEVKELDVTLLADHVLSPILGIEDQRTDPRIDFVGGLDAIDQLEQRVTSGESAVAFVLYPTDLNDMFEIADRNEVMPPKSTWFEPKLADGMVWCR